MTHRVNDFADYAAQEDAEFAMAWVRDGCLALGSFDLVRDDLSVDTSKFSRRTKRLIKPVATVKGTVDQRLNLAYHKLAEARRSEADARRAQDERIKADEDARAIRAAQERERIEARQKVEQECLEQERVEAQRKLRIEQEACEKIKTCLAELLRSRNEVSALEKWHKFSAMVMGAHWVNPRNPPKCVQDYWREATVHVAETCMNVSIHVMPNGSNRLHFF